MTPEVYVGRAGEDAAAAGRRFDGWLPDLRRRAGADVVRTATDLARQTAGTATPRQGRPDQTVIQ